MGARTGIGRSEVDLGRLLVQRQIITAQQLEEAIQAHTERLQAGDSAVSSLGKVLVEKGFIPSEDVLQALRSESGVLARCAKCNTQFKILSFNPASSYTCKTCNGPLAKVEAAGSPSDGATTKDIPIVPAALAAPSPKDVAAAAQDPGNLFGKYILVKELARGGGGIVYKAWDSFLSRYIVLKFLRTQSEREGDTPPLGQGIKEFLREARLAARIRHPNIVPIHEVGCLKDQYYISMDFIGGTTLAEVIHGRKGAETSTRFAKEPEKFLRIVRDVARAVEHAHQQKPPIVHRDLKPQNVLVDSAGQPYVTDFGLALQVRLRPQKLEAGLVKGTPSYMAPEQADARYDEIDSRTDVYSLGAIFYEVLCGRPPFIGDDLRDVVVRVREERPNSPTEVISFAQTVVPDGPTKPQPIPRELERICLKALSKKKQDRYQSAKEFAEEIDGYLKSKEKAAIEAVTRQKVLTQQGRNRWRIPLVTAVASVAVALGLFFFLVPDPPPPVDPAKRLAVRADRHLAAAEWSALETVAAELKRLNAAYPGLKRFEAAIREHREAIDRARADWKASLDRLEKEPLAPVIAELRTRFQATSELRSEFQEQLKWALAALQPELVEDARQLVAAGPGPRWLDEEMKRRAGIARTRIEVLQGLEKDEEFAFQADAGLEAWKKELDLILAYQGTWDLQINVAPFAEVVLRRSGKVFDRKYTPLGYPALSIVPGGYEVELFWPSQKDAKARLTRKIEGLNHGATVVIRGDMTSSELFVDKLETRERER